MMVFPYEGVYIGLVQMFHKERDTCRLEIELAVSRDTVHFTRVGDGAAFLPVGAEGSWDRFDNSLPTNSPLPVGDTPRFYYGGRSYRHSPYNGPAFPYHGKDAENRVGPSGWRRFREIGSSRCAGRADEGRIVTPPLRLAAGDSTSTSTPPGVDPSRSARPGRSRCRPKRASTATRSTYRSMGARQPDGIDGPVTLQITLRRCRGVRVVVPVSCMHARRRFAGCRVA